MAPNVNAVKSIEGTLRIFDNFLAFFTLEMSGIVYCGFNLLLSTLLVIYLLVIASNEELDEGKIIIYATVYGINLTMLLSLIIGIKMVNFAII